MRLSRALVTTFLPIGRIGRRRYLFTLVLVVGAIAGLGYLAGRDLGLLMLEHLPLVVGVYIVAVWLIHIATINRLHDTGRSGWSLAFPFVLYAAATAAAVYLKPTTPVAEGFDARAFVSGMAVATAHGLNAIFWIYLLIVGLSSRGDDGDNRYGPDRRG